MRWGKIILLFQAVVVLIMGLVFLSQLLVIDDSQFSAIKSELNQGNNPLLENVVHSDVGVIKSRYTVAAWLLPIISLLEIFIISRAL